MNENLGGERIVSIASTHGATRLALAVAFPAIVTPYGIAAVVVFLALSQSADARLAIGVVVVAIMALNLMVMLVTRRLLPVLGLYVTAREAFRAWEADPDRVHLIDVRTPEEWLFVGHAPMAWKIPVARQCYQWDSEKQAFPLQPLPDFVSRVQQVLNPVDTMMVMCRSGGRSAIAVNMLANAGFTRVCQIVDGMEGDVVADDGSVFNGWRMRNGWKNSGCPWTYKLTPERMCLP